MLQYEVTMYRNRSTRQRRYCFLATAILILPLTSVFPQAASESSSPAGEEIVPFLNQTLIWYRQLNAQQQLVNEPSDILFLSDNRQVADQVVRFSFDFARVRAQATQPNPGGTSQTASGTSSQPGLTAAAAKADEQVKGLQQELDTFHQKLANATGRKRTTLQAQISETEGELELFQARREILHTMLQFASDTAANSQGQSSLSSQIEELARTVPVAARENSKQDVSQSAGSTAASTVAAAAKDRKPTPTGIFGLATDLFDLRRKLRVLDETLSQTDSLAESAKALRTPLVAKIRELTKMGDDLAAQPDSQDTAVLAQQRKELDALTVQFKQLSVSLLPLGKQSILLDLYKRNSTNWRSTVDSQFKTELKSLLLRLGGLALVLGIVIGLSQVWRRAILRYVTDVRRRYQFLLIRRIVLWCLVAIIVAAAFASELGAITTFAGLLTAGVAVSLQNVILSIAGYFFLIGKYGVRVGDRVQIAGVTGDVVDIGLVRLHLMEVSHGPGSRPTGRVVAFSNGVVFQADAGMFKQIPGTSFLWHEITLTLGLESEYREVEKRMLEVANKVMAEYKEKMEVQRLGMESALTSVTTTSFVPESHLRLTATGLEVVIRYPVELGNAAEVDDRITRELLDAIEREPKLRLVGTQITTKSDPGEEPARQVAKV